MEYSKTIFKKDSTGKIRFLTVYTEGADLIQDSGVVGSDNPVQHRSTCTGKNIGRANETTPEQQAQLEAASKIESKMSTGYFDTVEAAEEKGGAAMLLPMLAKDYKKEFKKIDWSRPVFVQPKLDGMRALGTSNRPMISRKGKEITTMSHIQASIDRLAFPMTLDGELYAHGRNFQENMRLIKKDRGAETKEVKYHVYDIVEAAPFSARYKLLSEIVMAMPNVELVPTFPIRNEEDLKRAHAKFLSQGYEGTIVRHGGTPYGINKRDGQLLKYKDFIDIACEVVDVVPAEKNPLHGVVHCKNDKGTFGCGMKFSHKEREEILANKNQYIGKMAEVRFFEYSEDGIPRFPVCVGFREDK